LHRQEAGKEKQKRRNIDQVFEWIDVSDPFPFYIVPAYLTWPESQFLEGINPGQIQFEQLLPEILQ